MKRSRILVVGDALDDVLVEPASPIAVDADTMATISRRPGGSAANTAMWLAVAGASVTLAARVGASDLERWQSQCRAAGVEPMLSADPDRRTGTAIVIVEGGARTMLTDRGANVRFDPGVVSDELLAECAVLHISGYVVAGAPHPEAYVALAARARAAGATVSVDPGSASFLTAAAAAPLRRIIARAGLLFPNLDEGRALTRDGAPIDVATALARGEWADAALPSGGERTVALTLAADGSLVAIASDGHPAAVHTVPAESAQLVDSTGAGDAFAAGFLAHWVRHADPVAAASAGAALASRAVSRVGGQPEVSVA